MPRVPSKRVVRLPRGKLPASVQRASRRRYTPVSDEPRFDGTSPDPLSDLINSDQSAPLMPAGAQFTSRREARMAAGASPRKPKLSRRDQAAIKKAAATPLITPSPKIAPGKPKKQNPIKVVFAAVVVSGIVLAVALPAAAGVSSFSDASGI